jgi:N,N-dimethylformamidase
MKITGYTGRWVFSPGGTVPVHVSTRYRRFSIRLARHSGPIERPEHWAERLEWVDAVKLDELAGVDLPIQTGSSAVARFDAALATSIGGVSANFFPTRWSGADDVLLRLGPVTLKVRKGALVVAIAADEYETGLELPLRRWSAVSLTLFPELAVAANDKRWLGTSAPRSFAPTDVVLAEGFEGKVERPHLLDRAGRTLVEWDFGKASTREVPGSPPLQLINGPTLRVTGRDWKDLNSASRAAAFHRDDLADAGWPVAAEIRLPATLRSGAYAIVLSQTPEIDFADRASFDILPLFVTPGARKERVALVMPTFSYRAYANSRFFEQANPDVFKLKAVSWSKPLHDHADALDLKSLYDRHADGSGVALASLDRPQLTVRGDYISLLQGFPHQYSADLSIVGFLEESGIGYDVLTDEFLHERGADALAGYAVVLTGSHPEYASPELLDAYEGFAGSGGSLIYLGGNGFYWSVGIDAKSPALMEVRRRDGVRTWTAAPGETKHQTDGRSGGLWRSLGRPPNRLFGICFSAHGYSGDGAYLAAEGLDLAKLPPRTAAAMSEIGDRRFGIAGLELDCYDEELGSPGDTVVLAHAVDMPAGYVPAIEMFGAIDAFLPNPATSIPAAVKGDVVLGRLPGGGQFFSVGSIRWTSGLLEPGDPRFVRRLTEAVLKDFLDA